MSDSAGNPRKILLKGSPNYEEYIAGGNITPGMLCQLNNNAGVPSLVVHATSGGYGLLLFAIEFPLNESILQGGNAGSIDTVFASGQRAAVNYCKPGDMVNAFIKAGQTIVVGDLLVSAGDGTLIKSSTVASGVTVKQIIAVAEQSITLTASGAVATRIKVRIL